jgi:hypothetical protein
MAAALVRVLVALAVLLGLARYPLYLVPRLLERPEHSDFGEYWTAARLALAHGWAPPYDVERFRSAFAAFSDVPDGFSTAPPVTWLVAPLTGLPFRAAFAVWLALLLAAVGWAWWTAAAGSGLERGVQLLLLAAALPFVLAVELGQVALLVERCWCCTGACCGPAGPCRRAWRWASPS